jgi:hypothetical protein
MGCGSSTPANAAQPAAGPQKAAPAPANKAALKAAPPPVIKAEVTVEEQARFRSALELLRASCVRMLLLLKQRDGAFAMPAQ